jgi:hypothetical protein
LKYILFSHAKIIYGLQFANHTSWGMVKQWGELNNKGVVLQLGIEDGFMGAKIKKLVIEKISPILTPLLNSVTGKLINAKKWSTGK